MPKFAGMEKTTTLPNIRTFLVLACIVCLSAWSPSRAQSIVGKWKRIDVKETMTDKASGKVVDLGAQIQPMTKMIEETVTLNADHTMVESVTMTGGKPEVIKGTYSLSGDKLTFDSEMARKYKIAGGQASQEVPSYLTVKFSGGNMVWSYSVETKDEGQLYIFNMQSIYQRL